MAISNKTKKILEIAMANRPAAQEIISNIQGGTSSVSSVNTKTGDVVISKSDIGLSNVDNTSDLNKPISNATQSALDSANDDLLLLETYVDAEVVHVSKNGNDLTGTGGQHSPFLSLSAAFASITDAAPTKRYVIRVAAGTYAEAAIALPANVFVVGEGQKEAVRISGPLTMGASFTATSAFDNRSGFSNVTLLGAANFDWNAVQSAAGKLYFNQVVFASTVTMYGYNNAIAQAQFSQCQIFSTFTVSGINVGTFQDCVCFGNIVMNQHPNGGMATLMNITGGYASNITQTTTANDFNRRCATFIRNHWCENLTVDGPSSYADVDLTSGSKQGAVTANGGQVIALTPVISHDLTAQMITPRNTNAHNMGDWGKQWAWNFGWVHASTGTDLYVISYPDAYAADSSGKSIGIYTDGAGLQADVDGGSIDMETAAVSGTGTRGKIRLSARVVDFTKTPSIDFVIESGITASRPISPSVGQMYFDTSLDKPIWYNGSDWKDASGVTV